MSREREVEGSDVIVMDPKGQAAIEDNGMKMNDEGSHEMTTTP